MKLQKVLKSFKKKVSLDLPKDLPFVPEWFDIDFELLTNKAVVATPEELEYNNRAHSAKLRAIKRKQSRYLLKASRLFFYFTVIL